MKKILLLLPLIIYFLIVYRPFLFQGKLPIPADTIVGLYHPWRDYFSGQYPSGIPFKNSLITDAVRQEYPWRQLAISEMISGKWPSWNPYSFTGYPLAANIQSAPFYPLNILYLFKNFSLVWSIQVMLQTILGAFFMGLFLRSRRLAPEALILGTVAWVGSGFFISWLETNTIVQTAIWLPLALYALERKSRLVLTLALVCSILAGHAQTFMYILAVVSVYALWGKRFRVYLAGIIAASVLTSFFWWPAMRFIFLSGRSFDQMVWQKPDWFLPWQNLVQFVAPDYFGNPATLNYFGIWNYAEFVGYIGLVALVFSLIGLIRKDWYKNIFVWILGGSLIMALHTPIAEIPYRFQFPLIGSSQPSRVIVMMGFALAVLAAQGMDKFIRGEVNWKRTSTIIVGISVTLAVLWVIAINWQLAVSRSNLILPTIIFASTGGLILTVQILSRYRWYFILAILFLAALDSSRFAVKFLPFSPKAWLFPQTKILSYLGEQQKKEIFRVNSLEDRVVPDNFLVVYGIQTPSGYDPLYPLRFGEFIAAMERNAPDINPPFHYNRSITPRHTSQKLYALLNVKYILAPYGLFGNFFKKVLQEGDTELYELSNYLPRAFFVQKVQSANNRNESITKMFAPEFDPSKDGVVEGGLTERQFGTGSVRISKYTPNEVLIETKNNGEGFLVLLDAFYPDWRAEIDGRPTKIYITDYTFRGVVVPPGGHTIRFYI